MDAGLSSGDWQPFDTVWWRSRFDGVTLPAPPRVTALHNGIVIHSETEPVGPTTYQDHLDYEPHGAALPRLQDRGFRKRFRSIWYRPL